MSTKKLDPRTKRSRRMLRDALIELIQEKEYREISVSDLAERAELNRATFYIHYKDKQDLLKQSIDEVLLEMTEHLQRIESDPSLVDDSKVELLFLNALELISKNSNFYKVMLSKSDMQFTNQFQELFRTELRDRISSRYVKQTESDDTMPIDLFIAYASSACIGAIKWWLENDLKYTPLYLSKMLSRLIKVGYNSIFT